MIFESHPWKKDILAAAKFLKWASTAAREWDEERDYEFEKSVFVGAYAIRKLLDSYKVTDKTAGLSVPVSLYNKRKGAKPDILNRYDLHKLYVLTHPKKEQLPLRDICNQFIHSFIFVASHRSRKGQQIPTGLFFASDRFKEAGVYWLSLHRLTLVFGAVGRDHVTSAHWEASAAGPWRVSLK